MGGIKDLLAELLVVDVQLGAGKRQALVCLKDEGEGIVYLISKDIDDVLHASDEGGRSFS